MAPDSTRPLGADGGAMRDTDGRAAFERIFAAQRAAFLAAPNPSRKARAANLARLAEILETNENAIVAAVNADFGCRAKTETVLSEVLISVSAAKLARKRLGRWMRPRPVETPLHLAPAKSRLEPQPLGVVGIVSPWNYPVQLAVSPAAAALAAGNRVMIKPSELTPQTSALLETILNEAFDETTLCVITGGVDVGQAFCSAAFDHLLFTGSTAIGQKVAEAAAKNLTPVTLELGGKSPAIVDASANLAKAGRSIAQGKTFNAGQTCVAPDYVLTPRDQLNATVDAIVAGARDLYPEIDTTTDYTSIVSDRHFDRLKSLVEDARDKSARVIEVGSTNALHPQRKLPLTIVVDPSPEAGVMQEEIFGPILPVLGVDSAGDAIAHVNRADRPLALYWFGEDKSARDDVLTRTISGGVTVNDTLLHVAQEHLPFGGVGKSGIGVYHGEAGFETFSHMKPVFYQSRFAGGGALHPPYTNKTDKVISLVRKIL